MGRRPGDCRSYRICSQSNSLRAIPHIFPPDTSDALLYCFVREHGNFGIHNTSITVDADGEPIVTSLHAWETGCNMLALLSYPLVAAGLVDLIANGLGEPSVTRMSKEEPATVELEAYAKWARHYIKLRSESFEDNLCETKTLRNSINMRQTTKSPSRLERRSSFMVCSSRLAWRRC